MQQGFPELPRAESVSMESKVGFLSDPASHDERPARVERIETHMSWVFLTDRFVYKMKKPVVLPYLDFSTLALRYRNCHEELRLNRRLAPDVYLDVLALTLSPDGELVLDGEGPPVEWLVKMRRLPRWLMLDQALVRGAVDEADVARFTRVLAAFYRLASPAMDDPIVYRGKLDRLIGEDLATLRLSTFRLDGALVDELEHQMRQFLDDNAGLLESRVSAGRIIEGHGDLRPEHICLTHRPMFIDCLEFNRELRILDAADELAFLALECDCLGAAWVGERALAEYGRLNADEPPAALIGFYKARRALLRAKLCLCHLLDHRPEHECTRWRERADDYLARARRCLVQALDGDIGDHPARRKTTGRSA